MELFIAWHLAHGPVSLRQWQYQPGMVTCLVQALVPMHVVLALVTSKTSPVGVMPYANGI